MNRCLTAYRQCISLVKCIACTLPNAEDKEWFDHCLVQVIEEELGELETM